MYHAIVRRRIRGLFDAVNNGDAEPVLRAFAPRFEHAFLGDHALGGSRRTLPATRLWYERLYRLLPDIHFDLRNIAVSGVPWNTIVVVDWDETNSGTDNVRTTNRGIHVVQLRWGQGDPADHLPGYHRVESHARSAQRRRYAGSIGGADRRLTEIAILELAVLKIASPKIAIARRNSPTGNRSPLAFAMFLGGEAFMIRLARTFAVVVGAGYPDRGAWRFARGRRLGGRRLRRLRLRLGFPQSGRRPRRGDERDARARAVQGCRHHKAWLRRDGSRCQAAVRFVRLGDQFASRQGGKCLAAPLL